MGGDRGIGRTVEHGLYGLAQFGIGAPRDWRPRAVGAERRIMRKRGTDRCRERGLEPVPRGFDRPRHGHDAIGDLHGAHAARGEERGGERRVLCGGGVGEVSRRAGQRPLQREPPGERVEGETAKRMRSGPLASCIFAASDILCLGLRHRAQPLEAVDAGAVAVGEGDADRIIADRPYRVGSMFNGTVAGSSWRRPFISFTRRAGAAEAQVATSMLWRAPSAQRMPRVRESRRSRASGWAGGPSACGAAPSARTPAPFSQGQAKGEGSRAQGQPRRRGGRLWNDRRRRRRCRDHARTSGVPSSPQSTTAASSGTAPRNGAPSASANRSPPPLRKMSVTVPQLGQQKPLMFSTTPRSGTFTCSNIRAPRRAILRLTSCGVVTITAPVSGKFCASVNCVSPVPGGRSRIR